MSSISDTLERLKRLRGTNWSPAPAPAGHLAEVVGFGSNPGALRGWFYAPGDLRPGAAMVVVLHGCTQTAAAYDHGAGWSDLARKHGFAVLLPEQQRANNPNACFNWFTPGDASRGSGEAMSIRQLIQSVVSAHGIDPARVYITGLSAGGAMAATMLASYPELFAGGAIMAGLPHGSAGTVPEAFERMRGQGGPRGAALAELVRKASDHRGPWPRISVWHGTADPTVHPSNGELIVEQWLPIVGAGPAEPADLVDGHQRRVWRDAGGRIVIEHFAIRGLGHGTPLSTRGPDAAGNAGPHMLEAGISSTRHTARSWGLLPEDDRTAETSEESIPPPNWKPGAAMASGPARVINDALRAAGLIR